MVLKHRRYAMICLLKIKDKLSYLLLELRT
jgi:hypothetical protein